MNTPESAFSSTLPTKQNFASAVEYALIAAGLALAIASAVYAFGHHVSVGLDQWSMSVSAQIAHS